MEKETSIVKTLLILIVAALACGWLLVSHISQAGLHATRPWLNLFPAALLVAGHRRFQNTLLEQTGTRVGLSNSDTRKQTMGRAACLSHLVAILCRYSIPGRPAPLMQISTIDQNCTVKGMQ